MFRSAAYTLDSYGNHVEDLQHNIGCMSFINPRLNELMTLDFHAVHSGYCFLPKYTIIAFVI